MPRKANTAATVKETKIAKKLPASDYGNGVLCRTKSGKEYQISHNPEKHKMTLWKITEGGYEKLAVADSPYDLYPLIPWNE